MIFKRYGERHDLSCCHVVPMLLILSIKTRFPLRMQKFKWAPRSRAFSMTGSSLLRSWALWDGAVAQTNDLRRSTLMSKTSTNSNMARTTSSWASMALWRICQSSTKREDPNRRRKLVASNKSKQMVDQSHCSDWQSAAFWKANIGTYARSYRSSNSEPPCLDSDKAHPCLDETSVDNLGPPVTTRLALWEGRLNALTKSATTPTQWWSIRYACSIHKGNFIPDGSGLSGRDTPSNPTGCKGLERAKKLLGTTRRPTAVEHWVDDDGAKLLHSQSIAGFFQGGYHPNRELSWPLGCGLRRGDRNQEDPEQLNQALLTNLSWWLRPTP